MLLRLLEDRTFVKSSGSDGRLAVPPRLDPVFQFSLPSHIFILFRCLIIYMTSFADYFTLMLLDFPAPVRFLVVVVFRAIVI